MAAWQRPISCHHRAGSDLGKLSRLCERFVSVPVGRVFEPCGVANRRHFLQPEPGVPRRAKGFRHFAARGIREAGNGCSEAEAKMWWIVPRNC